MPLELNLENIALQGFSEQAELDYREALGSYARDLLSEIERIESGVNGTGGQPEITSKMVADAEMVYHRGPIFKGRKKFNAFLQIVLAVSLVIFGALISGDILDDVVKLISAAFVLAIIVLTATTIYFRE